MKPSLAQKAASELIGTCFLLAAVIGSGVMAENLTVAQPALALLCVTLATAAALVAMILTFVEVSGAHFNPAVTFAAVCSGHLRQSEGWAYAAAQCVGAHAGVALAHAMFGLPLLQRGLHARSGPAQWGSEGVATFGLVVLTAGVGRGRPQFLPFAVAAYVASAYWFTASTAFANPAATLARCFSATGGGIASADVGGFLCGQVAGAVMAVFVTRWLFVGPKEG